MIVLDCAQRSPEWHQARVGLVCASYANDLLATIQKGEAADRRNLRVRLVLERLTGRPQESDYQSADMLNGIEREATAVALYEARTGALLNHAGFIQHDTLAAGWSPDGFTDDCVGFIEAKCPKAATHYDTLRTGTVPTKYLRQMLHGGFWIGGAQWGDFVSYHPDFPEQLQLVIVRVVRPPAVEIEAHEKAVKTFLAEVERDVATVQGMLPEVAPAFALAAMRQPTIASADTRPF